MAKTSCDEQRRQAHRRLVHQDHRGSGHQGAADRQHLLFAAGQIPGKAAALGQTREVAEDQLDVGLDLAVAADECAEPEILQHRHVGNDAAAFHDLGNAAAHDSLRFAAVGPHAVEHDLAAGDRAVLRLQESGDGLQHGRLAGAIRAQQGNDCAACNAKAHAAQRQDHVVIDHLDVLHAQQRWERPPAKGEAASRTTSLTSPPIPACAAGRRS